MRKNMSMGIMLVLGIISLGVASALASDTISIPVNCSDKLAFQRFTLETAGLTSALKAKNNELSALDGYGGIEHGYDGIDFDKISKLEAERDELMSRLNVATQKSDILTFCKN